MIGKAGRQSFKRPKDTHGSLIAQKRKILEASVFALQEGDGLIQALNQAWLQTQPSLTPPHIRHELGRSIEIVEIWMETIYDRRTRVTRMLQDVLDAYKAQEKIDNLESEWEDKYLRLQNEALDVGQSFQEANQNLRLAQQLLQDTRTSSDSNSEYQNKYEELLAQRVTILERASDFFRLMEDTMSKLIQMEATVRGLNTPTHQSLEMIENLEACLAITDKLVSEAKDVAKETLVACNAMACETSGVNKSLERLKEKADEVKRQCQIKQQNAQRKSASMKNFHGELKEVSAWLRAQGNQESLGKDKQSVLAFNKRVKEMLQGVQRKSHEVEGMLGALKIIQDDQEEWSLDATHQKVVKELQGALKCLEERLEIGNVYLKFLQLVDEVQKLSKDLMSKKIADPSLETQRQNIQQLYLQICNTSKNCIALLDEKTSADVDVRSAKENIRSIMNAINAEQSELINIWNARKHVQKRDADFKGKVNYLLQELQASWKFFDPFVHLSGEPSLMVSSLESSYVQISNVRKVLQKLEDALKNAPEDVDHGRNEFSEGQVNEHTYIVTILRKLRNWCIQ